MTPTPQDQQPTSDIQDLSVVKGPIDESSIVPAESVEAESSTGQLDALSVYEKMKEEAPVAVDPNSSVNEVIRSRTNSNTPSNSGMSRGRQIMAGIAVVAAGSAAGSTLGAALSSSESESVNTNGTTEQVQPDESDQSKTDVSRESITEATAGSSVEPVTDSKVVESETGDQPAKAGVDNNTNDSIPDVTTPVESESPNIPSDSIGTPHEVVGPQDYPGEITVLRSTDLAMYLMDNQATTGITPVIELDGEYGTFTFSDPSGNTFIISSKIDPASGTILIDGDKHMKGISSFTTLDADGTTVSVKNSNDMKRMPAVSVSVVGQTPTTTDPVLFPGVAHNAEQTSQVAAKYSAQIDNFFRTLNNSRHS